MGIDRRTHWSIFPDHSLVIWARQAFLALSLASGSLAAIQAVHAQDRGTYPAVIETKSVGGEARLEVLGERYAQGPAVASSQSRIVLYRSADSRDGATSIFVDDRYHDSLVPSAWSQLCYRSGAVELAVRHVQAATRPAKDRYDTITALTLQPGQVHYLRVGTANNRPVLQPVAAAQALQEMTNTREQVHTVSRVAQECLETAAPVAVVGQPYTLAADTLFAFDRSDRAGMTATGTRAIDLLLVNIQRDYSRVDRVHLVGHADPLGQPERNERLAIERANTVRDYITQKRQLQAPMTAEGRGSREPVVRHCGPAATAQAIACNLPNRRVVVEVTGQRR